MVHSALDRRARGNDWSNSGGGMKSARRGGWVILVISWLVGCGPVPGGSLGGSLAPLPSDWAATLGGEHAFCEIESRPSDPHSIQLDCFLYEGELFAQSHRWALASWWPVESWAAIWIEEPEVLVRIGEQLFELEAVHVTDPATRGPVLRERGYDPPPEGIVIFRFEPRG